MVVVAVTWGDTDADADADVDVDAFLTKSTTVAIFDPRFIIGAMGLFELFKACLWLFKIIPYP